VNNEVLEDRIAQMAFAPLDEIAEWLGRFTWVEVERGDGYVTARTPEMTVGIAGSSVDPVNQAVQLAFVFAGTCWPYVFPGLLRRVNRIWKEERTK